MSGQGGGDFSVSPDGRRVALRVQREGNIGLAIRSLDSGRVDPSRLSRDLVQASEKPLTRRSRRLLGNTGTRPGSWTCAPTRAQRLFVVDGAVTDLRYHPGGGWVSYASAVEGRPDVFLRRSNGVGEPTRVSIDGGRQPRWNSTGTELYYIDARDNVVAVPFRPGAALTPGSATIAVPAAVFTARSPTWFDVAPDGRRFYFIVSSDTRSLDLVLNWRAPDK